MKKEKKRISYFKTGLLLFGFLLIVSYLLFVNKISYFDNKIYQALIYTKNSFMTTFFKVTTYLASFIFLASATIVLFIINRKKGFYALINLTCTVYLNQLLKLLVMRPRPSAKFALVNQGGFSFPSGHAMAGTAFYGLLLYWLYKSKYKYKSPLIIALLMLIFLISISRIYLGVHYASDVIGGILISSIWLIVFINLTPDDI